VRVDNSAAQWHSASEGRCGVRVGGGGCCVHGVAVASATVVAHGVLGDREVQERRPP
jgi:hypothetical protein